MPPGPARRARARRLLALAERLGDSCVQLLALAWEELASSGLAHQRVAEAVGASVGLGNEQPLPDRLAEGRQEASLGQLGDRREELVIDAAADGRGRADDLLGGRIESCEMADEDVAQRGRDRVVVLGGGQQLLGDERVAIRPGEDPLGHVALRRGAQDVGQELAQVARPEAREVDPLYPAGAADPRQPGPQPLVALGLVVAEGGDDERALVAQVAHHEGEEVEGRGVGPVHVLDDPYHWIAIGEAAQQAEQQLE
jgi:hypothetical protein